MYRSNAAASGSASISVGGAGYGFTAYSLQGRSGLSACEASTWLSDTALSCLESSGPGGSQRVSVTVDERVSSVTDAYSADRTRVSSVLRSNVPSTGSLSVTLVGAGAGLAGYSPIARAAPTASEVTAWLSDTSLRSMAVESVGGSRTLLITASLQAGSATAA
ncbi:hypothetical protein GUITHDRAFT_120857, partial [Guillardia theta CCMP2712]